jgi:hypothetical protein
MPRMLRFRRKRNRRVWLAYARHCWLLARLRLAGLAGSYASSPLLSLRDLCRCRPGTLTSPGLYVIYFVGRVRARHLYWTKHFASWQSFHNPIWERSDLVDVLRRLIESGLKEEAAIVIQPPTSRPLISFPRCLPDGLHEGVVSFHNQGYRDTGSSRCECACNRGFASCKTAQEWQHADENEKLAHRS